MGPFEYIGPYAETVITTRKSDVEGEADNKPVFVDLLIGLLVVPLALAGLGLMGLWVWAHIGPIIPIVIIGLAFWACGHYGSNRSVLAGWRYRTTHQQRIKIKRRLSGH